MPFKERAFNLESEDSFQTIKQEYRQRLLEEI